MKTSARCILPLLSLIAFLVPARAADVSKANNVTPLNTGGSWVGNNAPTATDVAVWDATVPAANTTQLGGSVSWQGIRVSNPGGTIIAADAGSANTLTLGVGGVDMSAAIRALQIQSRISLSGNQTWNVADAVPGVNTFGFNFSEDLSFAAQVAGALFDGGGFAVTKLGPGTAVISSGYTIDNTVFNVDAGTLIFSGAAGRTVNINTGVTVNVNTGATFRMQGASGATNYNGTLNLNGGTVLLTSSNANNAPSVNGPVHVNNASTILLANPMASAVSGPIVINGNLDGSAPLNITNTTTTTTFLRLGGDNSAYSGTVTFGGDPGHAARFTNSTAGSAAATWVVNADQTLELDGVDVQFGTLNGGGTITNSSTAVASSITVGAGNFTGSVIDGTLPMAVTKVGAGTLELIGANSFSGATTVQGGTLLMSPATVGVTNVTVADGAAFGVKLLSAGTTLTLSNVTVGSSAGGGVVFDLGTFGNPTVAPLNVTTFTPVAPTTLRISGANLANGTFPLLDYAGAIGGVGLAGLNVVLPPRVVGSLVNNAGSTRLDLNITGKDFPKWTGATNANWDIDNGQGGGTINWREVTSGNVTKYLQNASGSDSVLFDDTANPAGTAVNLTTLLQPTAVTVNNSALNFTFGGVGKLSGSTGLAKSGTGTLILSNTGGNDYTGATMISAGTLQIGDGATPGGGTLGTAAVTNDGTLALNRPDDFTLANAISGIGALVKSSAATATLTGVVNLSGGITINAGVLRFNSGGTLNGPIAGPGALHSGGGTLLLSGSNPNTFTGDIVVSTGVLQLGKTAGTNAVGGNIVITGNGLLQLIDAEQIPNGATVTYSSDGPLNPLGNETIANAIVTGPAGPGQLVGNNGLEITNTLSISGRIFSVASGHESTANRVNLSGGILRIAANQGASTLNVGAGGIVISGGAIQVGEGTGAFDAVLNLGGDFTATSNIDITRGGATETLRREINLGAGNRTFNIAAGTRTIVRPEVAGPGGLIKLGEGILEFLGINSYAGDTIVNRGTVITSTAQTGTANLVLADQTTVGLRIALPGTTFTTSTMTLGSSTGSSLQIDLGTTGNLTAPAFRATTVTANGTTAISLAGPMTPGNFTLIDYSGAIGGAGFGSFSLTLPLRVAGSLVNNTVNTSVDVNILGTDTPKWNGNVNANWDIDDGTGSGTANWKGAFTGNSTRYLQGASGIDAVIFDDTSMRANVDLTTTLTPNGITVNNSTLNYTFGGSGKLSGGATLTKQGSQTLIIANMGANDYTGATTVTAGTLQIGDGTTAGAGQLGSGTVNVEGALVFHRPDDFTVTNAIAGAGTLTKLGAGRTTLIGAITLTGDTTITSGALQIAGTANVPGRVINNATLLLESATPFTGTISGTGTVIARGGGTTQIAGFEANTYTGGTTVSAGLLQLNKTAGVNAIGGNLVMDGNGRVQLLAAEQIPDTASVTFDSNGGNVVFLNETFANLSVINGSETSQFQVQGGFVVTNRLTLTNGLFGVTSGTTDTNIGEVVISGGILRLGANNGISILEVGAGGITATGGLIQVGQGGGTFDAVLNLRGNYTGSGTVEFARGNFFGAEKREINLGDATRTFNVTSDITTIRPDIAGSGGLRKTGAGTLALFGANTFTGDTSIEAGTVVLAGSLGATPAITVKSGATLDVTPAAGGLTLAVGQTLKGAGTVVGSVAINGTLAPGEGIGTLTVGGDVTLSGTADFEINKTGLTLSADLASISGSLGFGGTLKVTRAGDNLAQGDAFNLFDASSFTGGFLNFDLPALAGGLFWDTGRLPVDGTLAVVPEPGSMAQAMVGVLSLLGFRLRRRSLN